MGWQDASEKLYQSGDAVGAEDLTLIAVWREIPTFEEDLPTQDTPESAPEATLPNEQRDLTFASQMAGMIVSLGTGTWIGVWLWRRKKQAE